MRVINEESGLLLVRAGRVAKDRWSRLRGLMAVRDFPEGAGLLLAGTTSIHSCFMHLSIDVLFIDGEGRIVDLEQEMRPWRMRVSRGGARHTLELPAGTIARTATRVGQKLQIE